MIISDFAKKAGVTVKTLLHYDKLGLIKADRDDNGYRVYNDNDFLLIQQITMLKFIGLSLSEIKDLVDDSNLKLEDVIMIQLEALKRKKHHIETVIESLELANQTLQDHGDLDVKDLTHIIKTTHMEARLKEQYKNDVNLNSRINIYQYTKHKRDFNVWCSEKFDFKPQSKVLEVGCGNGLFWEKVKGLKDLDLNLYLTDTSQGMLDKAMENLNNLKTTITYEIQDVQNMTYSDDTFDTIIGKHLLYHLPEMDQAIEEIKRVLTQEGQFIAATNGLIHMSELEQLVKDFDHRIEYHPTSYAIKFGLESGQGLLKKHFEKVEVHQTQDELVLEEPQAIIRYVKSTVGNARDILVDKKLEAFERYLNKIIDKHGAITISTCAGLIICKNPKRC